MSLVDDYNVGDDWLFAAFCDEAQDTRKFMASLVYGDVLEIGCGTGRCTMELINHCDSVLATDISPEFVEYTRILMNRRCRTAVMDVHRLPESPQYDCVFHFGALNTFKRPDLALAEMDRVTKQGGKVIVGDEGLAPWLRDELYGRRLIKANPLYLNQPPLHLLPNHAQDVKVHWLLGNAFYLIEYTKGRMAEVNIDLPIPGARGGTIRTRYEDA